MSAHTPENLMAIPGDGSVSLTWSPVSGASHYTVRRSTAPPAWEVIAETTDADFLDGGLTNGTTYYYTVTATLAESEPTGAVSATPEGDGPPEPDARPNVVIFLTDDHPPSTLSYMSEALALFSDRSVRFTNHYASNPLCGPSRTTLQTGKYAHNHGVMANPDAGAPMIPYDDEHTIATALEAEGYRCGLFGKYVNGFNPNLHDAPPGYAQAWIMRSLGQPAYFNYPALDCPTGAGSGVVRTYGTTPADYSTVQIEERAISFIESTPANVPLFLLCSFFAPHEVTQPLAQDAGTHASALLPQPPNFNDDNSDKGGRWMWKGPINPASLQNEYVRMLDTLAAVDRAIAAVVAALGARAENTLFLFLADNPASGGAHRHNGKNACLRAFSNCHLWIKAPDLAAGVRDDAALVSNVRLAATIADYTGATLATDLGSLRPRLLDPAASLPASILLETAPAPAGPNGIPAYRPAGRAVRTSAEHAEGPWLYVEYAETGERELFDSTLDPYEKTSLWQSAAHAAKRAALAAELATFGGGA